MSNPLYQQSVKQAMSKQVVTVDAYDTVHDALEIMLENKVHALPVIDPRGRCLGILSTSDFVDVAYDLEEGVSAADHESEGWWGMFVRKISQNVGQHSVMDLMTEDVVSVRPDQPLSEAADLILREHVHRLPVLNGDNRLLGILSTTDILKAMLKCRP